MNQLVQVLEEERPVLHRRKSEPGVQGKSGSKQLHQVVAAKPVIRKLAAARPELSELPQKLPTPAKKQRDRSIARKANARQLLPQRDPKNRNNIPARRRLVAAQLVAFSTAAVSAGRYFTPTSQARPEAKIIPDTNRNATCISV